MQLTRFKRLTQATERLGARQAIEKLIRQLQTGIDVTPEDLLFGEAGIYIVAELGVVTQVLVHICDISMGRGFSTHLQEAVRKQDFGNDKLIDKSHRYHWLECPTLQRARKEGWRSKYKATMREDGHFFYRFVDNKTVVAENQNQKLMPCKYCIKEFNLIHKTNYSYSSFLPKMIFESTICTPLRDGVYLEPDIASKPSVYSTDWKLISDRYRNKVGYHCEGSDCKSRNLSKSHLKKYLHCHHKNSHKADNSPSNLQALCIVCHTEQPLHAHIKNLPDYREYQELLSMQ